VRRLASEAGFRPTVRECAKRWRDSGASVRIIMPRTADSDIADFIAERGIY
jgi:hypothetical protein